MMLFFYNRSVTISSLSSDKNRSSVSGNMSDVDAPMVCDSSSQLEPSKAEVQANPDIEENVPLMPGSMNELQVDRPLVDIPMMHLAGSEPIQLEPTSVETTLSSTLAPPKARKAPKAKKVSIEELSLSDETVSVSSNGKLNNSTFLTSF